MTHFKQLSEAMCPLMGDWLKTNTVCWAHHFKCHITTKLECRLKCMVSRVRTMINIPAFRCSDRTFVTFDIAIYSNTVQQWYFKRHIKNAESELCVSVSERHKLGLVQIVEKIVVETILAEKLFCWCALSVLLSVNVTKTQRNVWGWHRSFRR